MNEYHRTIVSFLRDHGARDVRVVPGGRHPHVDFVFRDKAFNLAVHRDPPGHSDAALIKVAELRRLLGEPDAPPPREKRRLEDMMPAVPITNGHSQPVPAPPAEATWVGGMALYRDQKNGLRLRFHPPEAVVAVLPGAVACARVDQDIWRLFPVEGSRPTIRREDRHYLLAVGGSPDVVAGFTAPFGVSPSEYRLGDGEVLVHLLREQMRPIDSHPPRLPRRRKLLQATPTEPLEVGTTISAPGHQIDGKVITDVISSRPPDPPTKSVGGSDPRSILAAIAEVERSGPYRLVRLESGWAWRAPTIKLEDAP